MVRRSQTPHRSGKTGWLARLLAIAVVVVAGAAAISVTIAGFGMVTGDEFSPDLFQRRSLIYYQVPLLRLQITPVFRDNTTSSLERYLSSKGLIPQPPRGRSRWDIVRASRGGTAPWRGDAAILCNYLDQRDDDGNYVWLEWSKDYSDRAKCLWPRIAQAARHDLYTAIPELIHLAQATDDPRQLAVRLKQALVEAYVWSGQIHQQMQQHAQAVRHFTAALAQQRDSVEALRGRAHCYEALQQKKLAAADLRRLSRLAGDPDR